MGLCFRLSQAFTGCPYEHLLMQKMLARTPKMFDHESFGTPKYPEPCSK